MLADCCLDDLFQCVLRMTTELTRVRMVRERHIDVAWGWKQKGLVRDKFTVSKDPVLEIKCEQFTLWEVQQCQRRVFLRLEKMTRPPIQILSKVTLDRV